MQKTPKSKNVARIHRWYYKEFFTTFNRHFRNFYTWFVYPSSLENSRYYFAILQMPLPEKMTVKGHFWCWAQSVPLLLVGCTFLSRMIPIPSDNRQNTAENNHSFTNDQTAGIFFKMQKKSHASSVSDTTECSMWRSQSHRTKTHMNNDTIRPCNVYNVCYNRLSHVVEVTGKEQLQR